MRASRPKVPVLVPLTVLAALLACQTPETTRPSLRLIAPGDKIVTIDDHLAKIALESPEFGGMFWSNDGRLNVWLVDQTALAPCSDGPSGTS